MSNPPAPTTPQKITLRQTLRLAFTDRQVFAMLILGIASGLPYAAVGGTLNAWLSSVNVKPSAIGLLSWVILAYSFKFLWAAALQSQRTPFGFKIRGSNFGPRRFFMIVFLALGVLGFFALSFSNPPHDLGRIGLISLFIALASASFDIVVAGWRIESARDDAHLDILSAAEQFGYRSAGLLGGFIALNLAHKIGWNATFLSGTFLLAFTMVGVIMAAPSPIAHQDKSLTTRPLPFGSYLSSGQKNIGTFLVLFGWIIAIYMIGDFAIASLSDPQAHSPRAFVKAQGPWIIFLTVVWLGFVAAGLVSLNAKQSQTPSHSLPVTRSFLDIMFEALLVPMMDIIGRFKWASILILSLALSYRFTDLIWGSFAYPFYLGENFGALAHSLPQVAFASKLWGVIAIMLGIALGGIAMIRFGRMPVLFVGAILAAITNLLFADLAMGAHYTDGFLTLFQLDHLYSAIGLDIRMARLTTVIFAENIAVGIASAASVAYISSIVNKSYAVTQYALLVSLVMLLGTLGRPAIGELIETHGFASAFILCAWLGGVAVILSLLEWIRVSRTAKSQKSQT